MTDLPIIFSAPDLVDRLMDYERHGVTATDRVKLREDAAFEIAQLRQHVALLVRKMDVVELQHDQDSPGLWIGFRSFADRDEAMTWFKPGSSGVIKPRCGSYPLRYIAEDFGLPYDVVLNFADYAKTMDALPTMPIDEVEQHLSHWEKWAWCEVDKRLPAADRRLALHLAVRLAQGIFERPNDDHLPEAVAPARPLTEGFVVKGGHNAFPSQITARPSPPAPINAPAAVIPALDIKEIKRRLEVVKRGLKKAPDAWPHELARSADRVGRFLGMFEQRYTWPSPGTEQDAKAEMRRFVQLCEKHGVE